MPKSTQTDNRDFTALAYLPVAQRRPCRDPGAEQRCRTAADRLGLELEFRQSNAEHQLIDWLHANARALEIDAATLARGTLAPALQRLWQQAPRPRPEADGAARVADLLSAALSA